MKSIFLSLLLTASIVACAQNSGPIEFKKNFWGTQFLQNGNRLNNTALMQTLQQHNPAYLEMKKAKTNQAFSFIFSFAGGALIGWPIGTELGGGDANWTLAGIGAGLVIVAIPFEAGFTKRARNAVKMYNGSLQKTGRFRPQFSLGGTRHGFGLKMRF
ncbi:MAG: hypothetical protein IAE96_10775 [Chitinophagaceae bacterium]|nr:hypothetical protein [Chitinophagaceae bacterium]